MYNISMQEKMNLFNILKELSSPTKFKVMSFLWDCNHNYVSFKILRESFGVSQANLSKQLNEMEDKKIIVKIRDGRKKYFKIDNNFKILNKNIINPILNSSEAKNYKCICISGKPKKENYE